MGLLPSCGNGAKGCHYYDWTRIALAQAAAEAIRGQNHVARSGDGLGQSSAAHDALGPCHWPPPAPTRHYLRLVVSSGDLRSHGEDCLGGGRGADRMAFAAWLAEHRAPRLGA